MRKTFIEATRHMNYSSTGRGLFRLCGRLSLRRGWSACPLATVGAEVSSAYAEDFHWGVAITRGKWANRMCLFRLCGRLSLRPVNIAFTSVVRSQVSSAYAEDFHWGSQPMRPTPQKQQHVSSADAEDFHWGGCGSPENAWKTSVSSAYAEDFHWGQGKCESIPSFGFPLLI